MHNYVTVNATFSMELKLQDDVIASTPATNERNLTSGL